jgi:hypothetical protein
MKLENQFELVKFRKQVEDYSTRELREAIVELYTLTLNMMEVTEAKDKWWLDEVSGRHHHDTEDILSSLTADNG